MASNKMRCNTEGVDLIPANIELSGMEMLLVNAMSRETTLKTYLEPLKKSYDYVLIDCMPSLGMLTINALATADSVIVPVQAHYLPLKGMTQLMQTIKKVQRQINPSLKVDGVLPVSYTHLDVYKRQIFLVCSFEGICEH